MGMGKGMGEMMGGKGRIGLRLKRNKRAPGGLGRKKCSKPAVQTRQYKDPARMCS